MKNSNSQMRITDTNGVNRVIHADGTVLASSNRSENLKQVRSITFGSQDNEPMLPAGFKIENETTETVQRNSASEDDNLLLPTGFQMNENGEISTPADRQVKPKTDEKKSESQSDSDSELMLPAGFELEN